DPDLVGPLLDDVAPADGLDDGALAALADGDADAVALDQAAALVGDVEGDLGGAEAAVDGAGEGLQLRPQLLLADELDGQLVALVAAGEVGHHGHVLEEALDGGGGAVGALEDLDQADDLVVGLDRDEQQQVGGGVAGGDAALLGGAHGAV